MYYVNRFGDIVGSYSWDRATQLPFVNQLWIIWAFEETGHLQWPAEDTTFTTPEYPPFAELKTGDENHLKHGNMLQVTRILWGCSVRHNSLTSGNYIMTAHL